jgi:hypothetical protein
MIMKHMLDERYPAGISGASKKSYESHCGNTLRYPLLYQEEDMRHFRTESDVCVLTISISLGRVHGITRLVNNVPRSASTEQAENQLLVDITK